MRTFDSRYLLVWLLGSTLAFVTTTTTAGAAEASNLNALDRAEKIVRASGVPGGIGVVVGNDDLAVALSKLGRFTVHCLEHDSGARDAARALIAAQGVYGRVSAHTLDDQHLPYASNLLNIVVWESLPAGQNAEIPLAEILRVLAPHGTAWLGKPDDANGDAWAKNLAAQLQPLGIQGELVAEHGVSLRLTKPWPREIDAWSHFLHGADGNPVAQDLVVGPPEHYQWLSGPTWMKSHESDASVSAMVTAGGRLFSIIDEGPISLAGPESPPDKWMLAARDAFNGVELWKTPLRRWGWREWKHSWFNTRPGDVPLNIQKRLVATDDAVYLTLGYHAPVSQLDARTGEVVQTYEETSPCGEILLHEGTLILSRLAQAVDDEGVTAHAAGRVMAVDAATGKTLWVSPKPYHGTTTDYVRWRAMGGNSKPAQLDVALNMATDGDAVALIDNSDIVCLDYQTGQERWRAAFPLLDADLNAGNIDNSVGNLWNGTMIVTDGVVLHASPSNLAAFSAKTGRQLWAQPKKYIGHLWYAWKDIYVINGLVWTWTADLEKTKLDRDPTGRQSSIYPRFVNGYDLKTGEMKQQVDLGYIFKSHHHHRCYRNKATVRYILASRRGTEFVDLQEGKHTVHNWVRGICHLGMMPANGLQYVPPHPCQCYIAEKLNGLNALAPAMDQPAPANTQSGPRLEEGPAFGSITSANAAAGKQDWAAYRGNSQRSGSTASEIQSLQKRWRVDLGHQTTPPIAVGNRVFAALVDEHQVVCLNSQTGDQLWRFTTGARIDSPPTYHQGSLLVGSADGRVYCLRASDGELVWRFNAAPTQRWMSAHGQLESAWPVHGSVLVHGGVVYFAAGRSSQLDGGIHLFGLDPASGEVLHETQLRGPDYCVDDDGHLVTEPTSTGDLQESFPENYHLPMGALNDILVAEGTTIAMRDRLFNESLETVQGNAAMQVPGGLLDDSYFKRVPWKVSGNNSYSRLLVYDDQTLCGVRMFDSLQGLSPNVYFSPGQKGYLLFCSATKGGQKKWQVRVPIRVRAMALTPKHLVVAGPSDVIDRQDPLAAFEGRHGGVLCLFDVTTGEKLDESSLPSPPVFNGAAVAGGQLYLSDQSGSISCFGQP